MYQLMRYILLIMVLGCIPNLTFSQNPLKRELKGNSQSMHYSNSQYQFIHASNATVFISELNDSRSLNWNKQVNDSVRIEPIGDFWNFFYSVLFKNKINQDLLKANVKVEPTNPTADMYKVEPTVDVHYPNFVSYPQKGYWVLTKINMKVTKGDKQLFTKSYQEYSFFSKGSPEYKDAYNTDLKEGANVAMWCSMKRVLDQFYKDLDDVFDGKTVESVNTALNVIPRTSNIANDPNLNVKVDDYSSVKDKTKKGSEVDNYKMEEKEALPPPTDQNLDKAISVLGKADDKKEEVKKKIEKTVAPKKVESPIAVKVDKTPKVDPTADSIKLAEKKLREEMRKKAIDSALKLKEEIAKAAKLKEQEEKAKAKEMAIVEKAKRDSILKVNQLAQAEKLRAKHISDSIKKAEINQKIELAKKKREEEKAKLVKADSLKSKANKTMETKVEKPKVETPKVEKPKIEKTKPSVMAQKPVNTSEQMPVETSKPRVYKPKTGNEDISEEIRRIAREVEMEEMKSGSSKPVMDKPIPSTFKPNKSETPKVKEEKPASTELATKVKITNDRKIKMDSLIAVRKAKAEAVAQAIQKAKDSMKAVMAAKAVKKIEPIVIDPKKYEQDSIKLAQEKIKKREAILAAQKAAMEAERAALAKNPNAGEMFPVVSTDPPSKLPDNRTREQVLADRVFTPKSDASRDLLARVKLITPEEEARLLAMSKTATDINIDSFFIQQQINRPIPTQTPLDTTVPKKVENTDTKAKSKAKAVEKGLKTAKSVKDSVVKAKIEETKAMKAKASDTVSKVVTPPTPAKSATSVKDVDSAIIKMKAKIEAAKLKAKTTSTPAKTDEDKAKELESEIDKKTKEIKENIDKAKSW